MTSTDDVNPALVRMLLLYLSRHPFASDTPQGMARWWLDDAVAVREAALLQALGWLEEQRLIERVAAPDGRVRFRRHPGHAPQAWQARAERALATFTPPH